MTSQSNEDQIIEDLFDLIGTETRRFVEFGCGDGRQNNTIELLKRGWHGTWIEPHKRRRLSAMERWSHYPVEIVRKVVVPKNVNRFVTDPLDFLSIDIDGNDYAVWAAVEARPRVVCIEFDVVNGSSLEAIQALGEAKGYIYVGKSDSSVNAFFIDGANPMPGIWAIIALSLVIASIIVVVLGLQIAVAMWLVLLAIFIVLFTGARSPW